MTVLRGKLKLHFAVLRQKRLLIFIKREKEHI